jgi:hypothetical protein
MTLERFMTSGCAVTTIVILLLLIAATNYVEGVL